MIPGTSATVRVTFDRVRGDIDRGDGRPPLSFDSAAPAPPDAVDEADAEAVRFRKSRGPLLAMVGKSIEGTWRESGMLVKFDGLDGLRLAMYAGAPEDEAFRRAVDAIAGGYSMNLLLRPHLVVGERSLVPGEKRAFHDMGVLPESVGGIGFAYYKGTYALRSVVDGVARVEMEAEVSLDPFAGMQPWPAAAAELRGRLRLARGSCRAWARIETATGRLLEDEHRTELDLHLSPPGEGAEVPIPAVKVRRLRLIE